MAANRNIHCPEVIQFYVQHKWEPFKKQEAKYQLLAYFLGNFDQSFHPIDTKEIMIQSGQTLWCEGLHKRYQLQTSTTNEQIIKKLPLMYFTTFCGLDTHLSIREKYRKMEFPAHVTKFFWIISLSTQIISFEYPNSGSPWLPHEQPQQSQDTLPAMKCTGALSICSHKVALWSTE